ncbi:hypothetical protein SAMN05216360_1325 [Methylobacterium phyllostachyos]|uniref:Exosortase/archaeosortase family protein n=1 Tax=Methylobacterium phyllostachyos TaxID=582672 RepID=A0A1H0L6X2_9HYPH|nr:hypothetical protein [Methylobacterium phyllostachyos]SDO64014.1 hypothetical protein SAMN05216360_1325 [Methylobacterium phyllostachyos]
MDSLVSHGRKRWTDAACAARAHLTAQTAAWALLVFSGGTLLSAALQRHLFEQAQTARHLVEFNAGEAFALAALLSRILAVPRTLSSAVEPGSAPSSGSKRFLRTAPGRNAIGHGPERGITLARADRAVLVLSALAWFIPEQHGIYVATTVAGSWALLRRRADRQWIDIGQIWIALSIYELWGKLAFKIAYHLIEGAEVGILYRVGKLFYDGLGTTGASLSVRGDWAIVVLEGCSSFHNLSLAVLIWLSILKIADQPADRAALAALATSAAVVVAINVARILAMLPSREAYHFWHDGSGSSLVALASVVAVIIPTLFRIEDRACVPIR